MQKIFLNKFKNRLFPIKKLDKIAIRGPTPTPGPTKQKKSKLKLQQ